MLQYSQEKHNKQTIIQSDLGNGGGEILPFNRETALAETGLCTVIAFIFTPVAIEVLPNIFIPIYITITLDIISGYWISLSAGSNM